MDGWKWCRHETNFQYLDARNQGGIIMLVSISLLQFLFCKNSKFERMSDCNYSFIVEKG